MDDEEDDVFEPDSLSWRSIFREVKDEHRGSQRPGPSLERPRGMLPCSDQHRPLFYGEAALTHTHTHIHTHTPTHTFTYTPCSSLEESSMGQIEHLETGVDVLT